MQEGQVQDDTGSASRGAKFAPFMPPTSKDALPQADIQASEVFVKLLCQFEPDAVLGFLQSHETYRVQVQNKALCLLPV